MATYEHRQTARWLFLILSGLGVIMAMGGLFVGAYGLLGAAFILILMGIAFTTLTTRVDDLRVSWAYTFGMPGASIAFVNIAKVEVTTTNFWEGFGIHWTIWHGWLWNVAGYGAVMIHTRRGNVITLGTDDPRGLYDAILQHMPRS